MSKLTLADKFRAVQENPVLFELYCAELSARKISYNGHGKLTIDGKKVGHWEYNNAQKYAAGFVYDNHKTNV